MDNFRDIINNPSVDVDLDSFLHDLFRTGQFDLLATKLKQGFKSYPSVFSDACLKLSALDLSFSGWDGLFADWLVADNNGMKITGLGINISGHFEGLEPAFEVCFYSDTPYPFSTVSISEIMQECKSYGAKWLGRFVASSHHLKVSGFSEIMAIRQPKYIEYTEQIPEDPDYKKSNDYICFRLCDWIIYLRAMEALQRDIAKLGLPTKAPIVFSEHDFGPWVGTVFESPKVTGHTAESEEYLRQKNIASELKKNEYIEEEIESFRDRYQSIRSIPQIFASSKRKKLKKSAAALLKSELAVKGIKISKPLDKINEREFEDLISQYRAKKQPVSR